MSALDPAKPNGADASSQAANTNLAQPAARKDSLIDYPCAFPLKVMGLNAEGFAPAVASVCRHFDPTFDDSRLETRPSSGGKYLGVTATVTATSREQLDELYRTLSTHPMVKVVL